VAPDTNQQIHELPKQLAAYFMSDYFQEQYNTLSLEFYDCKTGFNRKEQTEVIITAIYQTFFGTEWFKSH
jgi:hypothetical protein